MGEQSIEDLLVVGLAEEIGDRFGNDVAEAFDIVDFGPSLGTLRGRPCGRA